MLENWGGLDVIVNNAGVGMHDLECGAALYRFNGKSAEERTSNRETWLVVLAQKMPRKEGIRNARHHN